MLWQHQWYGLVHTLTWVSQHKVNCTHSIVTYHVSQEGNKICLSVPIYLLNQLISHLNLHILCMAMTIAHHGLKINVKS